MKSALLIKALKKSLGTTGNDNFCRALSISPVTLHNWQSRKNLSPRIVIQLIGRLARSSLSGEKIINQTRKKLRITSLRALGEELGISEQAIQRWKGRRTVTPRQIAGLIASSKTSAKSATHKNSIRPLVEFFPINKTLSRHHAGYELFAVKDLKQSEHPYLSGLKEELEAHHGVYVFFDSRGQAIYSGKARRQSLWRELNAAFNRDRDSLQKIRRVRHPSRRQIYKTSNEKARQIVEQAVPLHELAAYFSAYDVADGMVDVLESLLVRSFANDLLNKKMEKFGKQNA